MISQLVVRAKEDENLPNSDESDLKFRQRINESRQQYSSAVPSCKICLITKQVYLYESRVTINNYICNSSRTCFLRWLRVQHKRERCWSHFDSSLIAIGTCGSILGVLQIEAASLDKTHWGLRPSNNPLSHSFHNVLHLILPFVPRSNF